MANITVVSTTDRVDVDFGDYASSLGFVKASFNRSSIMEIDYKTDSIQIIMSNGDRWGVSLNGSQNIMIVDTIDTLTPSSLSDLFDKLKALIKV